MPEGLDYAKIRGSDLDETSHGSGGGSRLHRRTLKPSVSASVDYPKQPKKHPLFTNQKAKSIASLNQVGVSIQGGEGVENRKDNQLVQLVSHLSYTYKNFEIHNNQVKV